MALLPRCLGAGSPVMLTPSGRVLPPAAGADCCWPRSCWVSAPPVRGRKPHPSATRSRSLGGGFSSPDRRGGGRQRQRLCRRYNNSAVKEMPAGCASSSCVTTLGGGFNHPFGVAVDGSGNVYVADTGNNAVKEMPAGCASSSCVTTLGGGFSDP